jgi:hypothetical protein
MFTFWINPFAADAAVKIESNSVDAIRATWDALHAAGFNLSARP